MPKKITRLECGCGDKNAELMLCLPNDEPLFIDVDGIVKHPKPMKKDELQKLVAKEKTQGEIYYLASCNTCEDETSIHVYYDDGSVDLDIHDTEQYFNMIINGPPKVKLTSDVCKEAIINHLKVNLCDSKDWKRKSKKKSGDDTVRVFEHKSGLQASVTSNGNTIKEILII